MKGERNLSDFWRHDASDDQVRELVSVLQGADILIGNMGSDLQVTWSSRDVSYTDLTHRIVALDYGPLRDQACPFQGTSVDEVVGYAAHEGGHCLWSLPGKEERVRHEMRASWSILPSALQDDWQADEDAVLAEVCRIQNVLEDAYIDHSIAQRWPVLGEYVRISRSRLFERVPFDLCAAAEAPNPDRNAAINLWVSMSLYAYSLPPNATTSMKQALDCLLDLSQMARDEEEPVTRQTMAAKAAVVLWQSFPVKEAPLPLKTPGQGNSEASQRQREEDGPGETVPVASKPMNLDDFDPSMGAQVGGRKVVPVAQRLLDQVAEVVAGKIEDLTPLVRQVLEESPRQVAARVKSATYDADLASRAISQSQRPIREVQEAFRR